MESTNPVLRLNLGCGTNKLDGFVNVDMYGSPDEFWNLNETPYPWRDNSADEIVMNHVLEHVGPWWQCFCECARILRPGGMLIINVPDASSDSALTYRDHLHVFSPLSFHGIQELTSGTNTWAATEEGSVPLKIVTYNRVPFDKHRWMIRWAPWLLKFCADHLRNYIWEQRFVFRKIGERNE